METLWLFAFAFVGGIVLNVMPCVLPVLTLKAFTILDHARTDPREQRAHGVAYAFGTMSALAVFGIIVVSLRGVGKLFGWGMQFQHPTFVAALTTVVFVFGLNALGVFELTFGMQRKEHEGLLGSVANGWLAAIMATPCSAPFLGVSAAFAMAADTPAWKTLCIFALVGAGLAFPFTVLSWVPALTRRLPRPGAWMETIKMVMGFSLMGTAVWLFRILLRQVTADSAALFLGALVVVALGLWAINRFAHLGASTARRWGIRLGVFAAWTLTFSFLTLERPTPALAAAAAAAPCEVVSNDRNAPTDRIAWVPFSPERVDREIAAGNVVFLDFTADWCTSCKANEKLVLETPAVRTALHRTGVVPVRVDMTESNDVSDAWLAKLGRNAIPAYALLNSKTMQVLPIVITVGQVVQAMEQFTAR